jgi:MFS family permease
MSTYAIFALSFIVRPFGGIFWGYVGDKYGRKHALSWSIMIMTLATMYCALTKLCFYWNICTTFIAFLSDDSRLFRIR